MGEFIFRFRGQIFAFTTAVAINYSAEI